MQEFSSMQATLSLTAPQTPFVPTWINNLLIFFLQTCCVALGTHRWKCTCAESNIWLRSHSLPFLINIVSLFLSFLLFGFCCVLTTYVYVARCSELVKFPYTPSAATSFWTFWKLFYQYNLASGDLITYCATSYTEKKNHCNMKSYEIYWELHHVSRREKQRWRGERENEGFVGEWKCPVIWSWKAVM